MAAQTYLSLINGLECLRMLASADGPVGSREMARMLDLEHTKVNRLLATLTQVGLAERTAERKYRPGSAIHVLAAQSAHGSRLLRAALPHLASLKNEGLMVALGVLWRGYVCYVYSSRPGEEFASGIASGSLFPVERSSIGLVMLAASKGKGEIREFVQQAHREGREVDEKDLLKRLDKVRRDGYALLDRGKSMSMAVSVGSPPVAGLAFAGVSDRRSVGRLVRELRDAADAIVAVMELQ